MNMTDLEEPRPGAEVSTVRCLYSRGMGQCAYDNPLSFQLCFMMYTLSHCMSLCL